MATVLLRFYAELNDHLPADRQATTFPFTVDEGAQVRSVIALAGIPTSEVDLVLVGGKSVGFEHSVHDGDRISVYPVFESFDISPALQVREQPLRNPRFVLDVHLGKLASYLRLLGFDVLYSTTYNDDELMSISLHERRTLLSRDRRLIHHPSLTHAYLVRANQSREQAVEVLRRFDLFSSIRPFIRCLACNTLLRTVEKEDVRNRLPPRVSQAFNEFYLCRYCDRVYWKGSHYEGMRRWIEDLKGKKNV
jgi:uncharacterized protein with PIN domain